MIVYLLKQTGVSKGQVEDRDEHRGERHSTQFQCPPGDAIRTGSLPDVSELSSPSSLRQ